MAENKLPFQSALEQNSNNDSTAFGKWYGQTYSPQQKLSLRGLYGHQLCQFSFNIFNHNAFVANQSIKHFFTFLLYFLQKYILFSVFFRNFVRIRNLSLHMLSK